jgi:hypothetical protein
MAERYGITPGRRPEESALGGTDPNATGGGTNDPNAIVATFRGVSLDHLSPNANFDMAFAVQSELKNSPLLNPDQTRLKGQITPDETNFTFSFSMSLSRKTREPAGGAAAPVDPNAAPADPNAGLDPNAQPQL